MIDKTTWWAIIENYNRSLLPFQFIVFIFILIIFSLAFFKWKEWGYNLINILFSISYLWISIGFFLYYGKGITGNIYGNIMFAFIFAIIAISYAFNVFIIKCKKEELSNINKLGSFFIILFYPIVSIVLKRSTEHLLLIGMMPCPTVALSLYLRSFKKCKIGILDVLLLMWALPMTPFLQIGKYGVFEDSIMFMLGVFYIVMKLFNKSNKEKSIN